MCEGVLYTDRPDKVGTIAQKIIGHKQSLEINPATVEYKINYDERKHFKNLEFTAGTFIGLSVLGNDEKPAFTGSEFFSQQDFATKFKDRIESLIKYCQDSAAINSNSTSSLSDKQGGNKVSTMNFLEFIKLS